MSARCHALWLMLLGAAAGPADAAAGPAGAADLGPSFVNQARPAGWDITGRGSAESSLLAARAERTLTANTTQPVALPVEATFRFRPGAEDKVTFAVTDGQPASKPLLDALVRIVGENRIQITVHASGEPMATVAVHNRNWGLRDKKNGNLVYTWRFPKVKNIWDERDRREIGAAYAGLTPFAEKTFALRFVLAPASRQVWIDDRLIAEDHGAIPATASFSFSLSRTATLSAVDFRPAAAQGGFLPVALSDYSHAKNAAAKPAELTTVQGAQRQAVPVYAPSSGVDIDLGQSLYHYRRSGRTGPFTGYVNALIAWPSTFEVDPNMLAFRVPYRDYQNVWLVAWADKDPARTPRGEFRFFRDDTGVPASTPFEITPDAIKRGLVTQLDSKAPNGTPLYLVRVPVDVDAMAGYRDLSDQFLDCELTKPTALTRTYPDPIYYGRYPAGQPSSLHVAAMTFEEAPFGFEVKPAQFGDVFEMPEPIAYTVHVTNHTGAALPATVTVNTVSYDGQEKSKAAQSSSIAASGAADVAMNLDLRKFGWHEVQATVTAGGITRTVTTSLVRLPRNTRTYGNAPNETRFGAWMLWGHYMPLSTANHAANEPVLATLRKLGIRRGMDHGAFVDPPLARKYDFLPSGVHTDVGVFHRLNENDPEAMRKMVDAEVAQVQGVLKGYPETPYFYGGEWGLSREIQYAPDPRYTGDGPREFNEEETARLKRQTKIFTAIGQALRQTAPVAKLSLQWGAPLGTIGFLRYGVDKALVDQFGMDQPQFEMMPETSNAVGVLSNLWAVRQEAKRLGWPVLPFAWTEGPFLPTNAGALSLREQSDYQVRTWLVAMANGVNQFYSGVVPFDGGNYYGSEHYGAGVFNRTPLENPKPAVASLATATAMLCGADYAGDVPTGNLTTHCVSFKKAKTGDMVYALWRIRGTSTLRLNVTPAGAPTLTDAMGNAQPLAVQGGAVEVPISSSPVWLTGVAKIDGVTRTAPVYTEQPATVTRALAPFTAANWSYTGAEDPSYSQNHFAVRRIADPQLAAAFGVSEPNHADAVEVTLPVEPGDRPLAIRYGALQAKQGIVIPGKAKALGLWVKGNASWGRFVYRLHDAKGEIWTAAGTKDDWNCDDPYARSFINFEGWRYVSFPLPGNHPYDLTREAETTWWGSHGGDGIVDLPLALDKIYVEARNELPALSEMRVVPERSYKLAGLVAEYEDAASATPAATDYHELPLPAWSGPQENPIAALAGSGAEPAPAVPTFAEPPHFNDGRRMTIHFAAQPGLTYKLYLSLYEDGRGAEVIAPNAKDNDVVTGMRPDVPLYLFLTATGADKKESKPSPAARLITRDNFAEK